MGLSEMGGAGTSKDRVVPNYATANYSQRTSEYMSAEMLGQILRTGDLIEFRRVTKLGKLQKRFYTHWGVYVGLRDGQHTVAHMFINHEGNRLVSAYTAFLGNLHSAEVRLDALEDVCTDDCRINNLDDRVYSKLDTSTVFKRALNKIGQHDYNIIYNNCEHFAKWCRYDRHRSNQVQKYRQKLSYTMKYVSNMMVPKMSTVYPSR